MWLRSQVYTQAMFDERGREADRQDARLRIWSAQGKLLRYLQIKISDLAFYNTWMNGLRKGTISSIFWVCLFRFLENFSLFRQNLDCHSKNFIKQLWWYYWWITCQHLYTVKVLIILKLKRVKMLASWESESQRGGDIYKRTWWRPLCLVVGDGVTEGCSSNIGKQQLEVTLVSKGKSTL